MEQKINLFLQNLRRLLDEKMQSGSNTTYGQSALLTDEQFEQVITDFGRLSREELVQLLTPIYTSPDWGNLIAILTERIVSDVIITGTGTGAEISYRTGNKTITQKIQETAPANTTTDTTTDTTTTTTRNATTTNTPTHDATKKSYSSQTTNTQKS